MLYRIRTELAKGYFEYATRGIGTTSPLTSTREASCEVHTMLGQADVAMYLLAAKSFVSYVPNVSVIVYSDGTLTQEHIDTLQRHIVGMRVVGHDEADQRAAVELPAGGLLANWRKRDAAYRRLIDIELWRRGERAIVLDSDVLTNRTPDEVARWIEGGAAPFLLGQPFEYTSAPSAGSHVQGHFFQKVPQLSAALGVDNAFLLGGTAGFCGYRNEISLAHVERALDAALTLGLPMHHWGGDQCLIIYLLSVAGGRLLPPDKYLNFDPYRPRDADGACVVHFYGTHRYAKGVYRRLGAAAVERLRGLTSAES